MIGEEDEHLKKVVITRKLPQLIIYMQDNDLSYY